MNKRDKLVNYLTYILVFVALVILFLTPFLTGCAPRDPLDKVPVVVGDDGAKYYEIRPESDEWAAAYIKEGDDFWSYIMNREDPPHFKRTDPLTIEEREKWLKK